VFQVGYLFLSNGYLLGLNFGSMRWPQSCYSTHTFPQRETLDQRYMNLDALDIVSGVYSCKHGGRSIWVACRPDAFPYNPFRVESLG